MAAGGEAAQRDTLELPTGVALATVPAKDEVAIPMLYDQTLKALQRALALHDPVALPLTTGGYQVAWIPVGPLLRPCLASMWTHRIPCGDKVGPTCSRTKQRSSPCYWRAANAANSVSRALSPSLYLS